MSDDVNAANLAALSTISAQQKVARRLAVRLAHEVIGRKQMYLNENAWMDGDWCVKVQHSHDDPRGVHWEEVTVEGHRDRVVYSEVLRRYGMHEHDTLEEINFGPYEQVLGAVESRGAEAVVADARGEQ